MVFIPDMRIALIVAPIWFLILYIGYKVKKRDSNERSIKNKNIV